MPRPSRRSPLRALAVALALIMISALGAPLFRQSPSNGRPQKPQDVKIRQLTGAEIIAWSSRNRPTSERQEALLQKARNDGFAVGLATAYTDSGRSADAGAWWDRLTSAKADEYYWMDDGSFVQIHPLDDGDPNTFEYSVYARQWRRDCLYGG